MGRITPFAFLSALALLCVVVTALTVGVALRQPWTGIDLARGEPVVVGASGPAAAIPVGARITAIGSAPLGPVSLTSGDLVEEPDMLPTYAALGDFLTRQGRLFMQLSQPEATVAAQVDGRSVTYRIAPAPARPLSSLPPVFWVQMGIALASALVGAWVWSMRRSELPAAVLALAGIGMLLMICPAAIYSTREFALEPQMFRWLSAIDHFGALLLGASLVTLFFVYPRPIMPRPALLIVPTIIAAWWLADTVRAIFIGPPGGFHLPVILLLISAVPAIALQLRTARGDPAALVSLRWFAASVLLGAGCFILSVIVPTVFGLKPTISQGYGFAFLFVIFIGVAVGVARYRLFELEDRAFRLLFYFGAVALLLLLDAALISLVALEQLPAFSLSLILVALVYLPARDWIARKLTRTKEIDRLALVDAIVDVALSRNPAHQRQLWHKVLEDVFQPLSIRTLTTDALHGPTILDEGVAMAVPSPDGATLRLSHARLGRHLFSPKDLHLAQEMVQVMGQTIERRDAHELGATEERARLSREMHDNIGAQLLSALRSPLHDRKDTIIRDALSDLRTLINVEGGAPRSAAESLAELRLETVERLEDAGIGLNWVGDDLGAIELPAATIHDVRSVLREAVTNTIRHSGAETMTIAFTLHDDALVIAIGDDGTVRPSAAARSMGASRSYAGGNGITNMQARLERLGGSLRVETHDSWQLGVHIPLGGAIP